MSRRVHSVWGLSFGAVFVLVSANANAGQKNCYQNVKAKAQKLVFDVTLQLDRHAGLAEDRFAGVNKVLQKWKTFSVSPAVRTCLNSAKFGRKLAAWMRIYAEPTQRAAERRLGQICGVHAEYFLRTQRKSIESALRAQQINVAMQRLKSFEKDLTNRPFIYACQPVAAQLKDTLYGFLPSVKQETEPDKVREHLARSYGTLLATWKAGKALMARKNASKALPAEVSSTSARKTFFTNLKTCQARARTLQSLGGAKYRTISVAGKAVKLKTIGKFCGNAVEGADEFLAFATRYEARHTQYALAMWRYKNVHGGGMYRVFKKHGKPAAVNAGSSRIVWVYRNGDATSDSCTKYYFSSKGKLRRTAQRSCAKAL